MMALINGRGFAHAFRKDPVSAALVRCFQHPTAGKLLSRLSRQSGKLTGIFANSE
jgi:hypothetical protein